MEDHNQKADEVALNSSEIANGRRLRQLPRRSCAKGGRTPLPDRAPKSRATMSEPRRNPKRKASEATREATNLPDNLLEEAHVPLTTADIEEWEGWVELESEPAFFNIILRDLGVQNVKAQEVFSIDQDSLAILPKPVFGLIFLFQYFPDADPEDEPEDTSDVWFANQTTNNACATVALLNIVMNAEDIELGEMLRDFKDSTQNLSTALRGHQLSRNVSIRRIHNSFTRRMDHLNADLALENEVSDANAKSKRRAAPKKGKKTQSRKKKPDPDYGFHFIAYVPAGGYVWELDGLSKKPHKLAPVPESGWISVARPQIEARMLQYEENQLSFNLLALCQSPLGEHSQAIVQSLARLRYLHSTMAQDQTFSELISAEAKPLDIEDENELARFQIRKSDIAAATIPETFRTRVHRQDFDTHLAYEAHQEVIVDIKSAMGEYRAELLAMADDENRVKGRKSDYRMAINKWVTKLAEKGVLENIIKQ